MHFNGIRGTCSGCGKTINPTDGFCAPCASYANGYAAGLHYADGFDGTTEESAALWAAENPLEADEGEDPARLAEGFLAGLKRVAAIREANDNDPMNFNSRED